ncbi:hypothetical protein C8Q74DRAFT_922189 [Fomes fomentarius]|nr:hypothetical protein C8Q74DRAFT_922189 [Fomes fomentarius]
MRHLGLSARPSLSGLLVFSLILPRLSRSLFIASSASCPLPPSLVLHLPLYRLPPSELRPHSSSPVPCPAVVHTSTPPNTTHVTTHDPSSTIHDLDGTRRGGVGYASVRCGLGWTRREVMRSGAERRRQ